MNALDIGCARSSGAAYRTGAGWHPVDWSNAYAWPRNEEHETGWDHAHGIPKRMPLPEPREDLVAAMRDELVRRPEIIDSQLMCAINSPISMIGRLRHRSSRFDRVGFTDFLSAFRHVIGLTQ